MPTTPKLLSSIIKNQGFDASSLVKKVQLLKRLDQVIKSQLPENMSGKFEVANIRDNTLIILANSPSWATRLHYQQQQILVIARSSHEFAFIDSVKVKVSPSSSDGSKNDNSELPASHQVDGTKTLSTLIDQVDDSHLKSALERLQKHTQKS